MDLFIEFGLRGVLAGAADWGEGTSPERILGDDEVLIVNDTNL